MFNCRTVTTSPHFLRVVTLPEERIQQRPSDQEHMGQINDALDLKSLYLAKNQDEHWVWQVPQQCKLPYRLQLWV